MLAFTYFTVAKVTLYAEVMHAIKKLTRFWPLQSFPPTYRKLTHNHDVSINGCGAAKHCRSHSCQHGLIKLRESA